ncbi:hypothetical protein, partial [Paenibacillus piscarius]|uniref:hypothetical protein n=1 Tax=Paenibacillus piscarius TaxID=1089681 RepID=UPI001EE983C7
MAEISYTHNLSTASAQQNKKPGRPSPRQKIVIHDLSMTIHIIHFLSTKTVYYLGFLLTHPHKYASPGNHPHLVTLLKSYPHVRNFSAFPEIYPQLFHRLTSTQKSHCRLLNSGVFLLGGVLLSQDPSVQVPSALEGLT